MPREGFASCKAMGSGFLIFGGIGDALYNDLNFYDYLTNYWLAITPIGTLPSERYGSCMAIGRYIYIIGGFTSHGVTDELWVYDFYSTSYILAQNIGETSLYILKHQCWIKSEEDYEVIFIMGGESYFQLPNKNISRIVIYPNGDNFDYKIIQVFSDTPGSIARSDSSVIISGEYILQFFGSIYNFFTTQYIVATNQYTFEASVIYLPTTFYAQTIVQYKKSFFIFGGGICADGTKQLDLYSSEFYNLTIEPSDGLNLICSLGTIGEFCEPCPAGTYGFNSTYCMPCPIGTISDNKGSDSSYICNVCDYGTYSDEIGATRCKECIEEELCMIGSMVSKASELSEKNDMIQPTAYSPSTGSYNKDAFYFFMGAIAGWLILAFFVSTRYRNALKRIDLYTSLHSQKENEPVMLKRTEIGGLFSAIFLVISLISIAAAIASYSSNNITEIKGLVPFITVTDAIVSKSFLFSVVFYGYGGACVVGSSCSKYMFISDSTLIYNSRSVFCEKSSSNCIVTIQYTNLQIGYNPSITISFKEQSSYASHLSINATSFSSIPGEISSILLYTYPDSLQEVFRGTTPTIFSLEITPSVRIN